MKIAILGATSHIANGLIYFLWTKKKYELFLFARNIDKLNSFLKSINCKNKAIWFESFNSLAYDVIINCVWIWSPAKLKDIGIEIFKITEHFDNMVLDYLSKNHSCLYINLSSWAIYWTSFDKSVGDWFLLDIDINHLTHQHNYLISKLNAEAKHRTLQGNNIIDLRLFSYFSRFIDPKSNFLLADIINAIKNKQILITSPENITRDYIGPEDLSNIVELCIDKFNINDSYDIYSASPITKFEILDFCKQKYWLEYTFSQDNISNIPTWQKNVYYSNNHKLQKLWYTPKNSSFDTIKKELELIINTIW